MIATSPQSYTAIVGAGLSLNIALAGSQFYFPVATGQIWARPTRGQWAVYFQGTGQEFGAGNMFYEVQVQNPNPNPVVFQIVASGNPFIDKRLVLNQASTNVMNVFPPSAPVPWVGENPYELSIPDLSGKPFKDQQGNQWVAIARNSLTVQVLDAGDLTIYNETIPIGQFDSTGGPLDPYTLQSSGPFRLNFQDNTSGFTGLPISVFEIYQAVQPGYASNPPS